MSSVVHINVEIHNVDSAFFDVVNSNVEIRIVVPTLIWRCPTSRRRFKQKKHWSNVEMFAGLNSKWLILETSRPPSQNEPTYVSETKKSLAYCRSSCDNILLLGDFNMSFSNKSMKDLCDMFELNHLIKDPTCFKSSNPSCIDNFYTNKMTTFFNSSTVDNALLDVL